MDLEEGGPAAAADSRELEAGEIEAVEPAQPIPANLIEFPRELVATRKMRPRLAETAGAGAEAVMQLSIFEVDPGAIALEPPPASTAAPEWTGPQWSGIELEAQPEEEPAAYTAEPAATQVPAASAEVAPALQADAQPESAPFHLRLMAAVVDGALIAGAFLAAATVAASNARELPAMREATIGAALAIVVVGFLYHAFFFTLAQATPGMKYARIRLRTLDGQTPTRAQRTRRLGAMLMSVVPVGLGVAWMLFDEESLSWHDRLSGTRLCKN